MCKHHWIIDSDEKGLCRLCGQSHDFKPGVYKGLKLMAKTPYKNYEEQLITGEYYLQGSIALPSGDAQWLK